MLRHWRIAYSAIFVALLIPTLFMWVRSYGWMDAYGWVSDAKTTCNIMSYRGDISINRASLANSSLPQQQRAHVSMKNSPELQSAMESEYVGRKGDVSFLGIHKKSNSFSRHFAISYWIPTILIGVLTGLPWYWRYLHFRFSLRTFLILFTMVALLLGYVMWQLHSFNRK